MGARTPLAVTTCLASLTLSANAAAAQSPQPSQARRGADEIRAIVAQTLADAQTRSSLLQASAGSGHDGRFFLASPDGNFRLNVSGQVQFRYLLSFRQDEPGVDDFEPGFSASRTALRFDGHIYSPNLFYGVQANFNNASGVFTLEDAFAGYRFDNGLLLLWGQYREPILWEDVLNETRALAVDQTVVNAVFGQGRSHGLWTHYAADDWRFWAGFNDGVRSANTDFDKAAADWGVTTRWEYKFAGDWSQFDQFASPPGSAFAAKLGAGAHFEQTADTPAAAGVTDVFAWTGDIMAVGDGWTVFVAGLGFHTSLGGGAGSFDDYGFLAQAGAFLTDDVDLFARYDVVLPDSDRAGDRAFNSVTAGSNWYLHGQAAKLTFDATWMLDDVADNDLVAAVAGTNVGDRMGLLPSGEANQVVLRLQFQLLF